MSKKEEKLRKAAKLLGEELVAEMESASTEDLRKRIAYATRTIEKTREELEALPGFIKATEDLAVLNAGFRATRDENNAAITYALAILTARGEAGA